tara:strand:- start:1238 stop:1474 length:237 start_codon:yes stop_codon:yes gene_type:complete
MTDEELHNLKALSKQKRGGLYTDMMQARSNLISQAVRLLGPRASEDALKMLSTLPFGELQDVVTDLQAQMQTQPTSAN